MEELKQRISNLTARKTPLSEPGREIETAVKNVRSALNEALKGPASWDYARNEIYALEDLFSPRYNGNTNHATSNTIAKDVGKTAHAILNDIVSLPKNEPRGASRRKTRARKTRARKTLKNRK